MVMLSKENRTIVTQIRQLVADRFAQVKLLAQPGRQDTWKSHQAAWRYREIRFQDTCKLGDRFVVEHHGIQMACVDARLFEAKRNRVLRKPFIVLASRESFL